MEKILLYIGKTVLLILGMTALLVMTVYMLLGVYHIHVHEEKQVKSEIDVALETCKAGIPKKRREQWRCGYTVVTHLDMVPQMEAPEGFVDEDEESAVMTRPLGSQQYTRLLRDIGLDK